MKISVLGSIEATVDGRVVEAPNKAMVLLISLALAAGRPVSAEVLADRLWDGEPGDTWRSVLHTYITRLRRRLETAGFPRTRLSQSTAGYVLDIAADDVDWTRFSALRSRASAQLRSGETVVGVGLLEQALGLWRGEPLPGLSQRWADDLRSTMLRAHQAAWAAWAREAPRVYSAEETADRLSEAISLYPLNEALAVHLMRALHRAGRSADALEAFRQVRERLAEETGADPHPRLLLAHQEVLRGTGGEAPRAGSPHALRAGPGDAGPGHVIATNLPRDLADFADRAAETDQVLCALDTPAVTPAARVCVLSGMPGVGKTSLAVHLAHRLAARFPDGALMVELHGHHEHQHPLSAKEALGELIHLAGVSSPGAGESMQQRTALWRDHTAQRRLLLVLDDAATAAQVLPLLPTGAGCAVIITSRQRLGEVDGARHLTVRVPEPDDAITVFNAIADPTPDPHTAAHIAEIVELCGHLPLAMRLMATRLGLRPHWSGAEVTARLRAAADTVAEFRAGHRHLAAAFAVSLRSLSPAARTAFLRLGLHPSPVIDRHIAAAMLGLDVSQAEFVLDELIGASLVDAGPEPAYRIHSLVMAFAHRAARAEVPPIEQHGLRTRMLHTYIDVCSRADQTLYPHRLRLEHRMAAADPVELPAITTKEAARRWLSAQLPELLVVIRHAARNGCEHHAALLTHLIAEHIDAHGPWDAAVELHRRALGIWRGGDDRRAVAQATYELARALLHAGAIDEAGRRSDEAAQLWCGLGDELGSAWALDQQGVTAYVRGDFTRALAFHQQAQALFERAGHRHGLALSLDRQGTCHLRTGEFHEAIAAHSDALRQHRLLADADAAINTKIHLAGAFQGLGYHRESTTLSLEALEGARGLHDRRREGIITTNLGEIAAYRGEDDKAFGFFHAALDIHRDVRDPWTEAVTLSNLGRVHLKIGQLTEAKQCFDDSRRLCAAYTSPVTSVETLLGLGEVALASGGTQTAHEHFTRAHEEAVRSGLRHERGQALTALGRLHLITGAQEGARTRFEAAEHLFTELSAPEAINVRIMIDTMREKR